MISEAARSLWDGLALLLHDTVCPVRVLVLQHGEELQIRIKARCKFSMLQEVSSTNLKFHCGN